MRARLRAGGLLLLLLLGSADAAPPAETGVRLERWLRPGGRELELLLEVPWPRLVPTEGTLRPELNGLPLISRPGLPELPAALVTIEVGEESVVSLEVIEIETLETTLALPPTPGLVLETRDEFGSGLERSRRPEPAVYEAGLLWPSALATAEPLGRLRGRELVRVRLNPIQVDPLRGRLVVHRRMRVLVRSEGGVQGSSPDEMGMLDRSIDVLLGGVPRLHADPPGPRLASSGLSSSEPPGSLLDVGEIEPVKLLVTEAGIHSVSPTDLSAAGVNLTGVDPRTFRITHRGIEIPIRVLGESDGVFDPTDRVLFHGEPTVDRYTGTGVYRLTSGGATGLRFPIRAATPSGSSPQTTYYSDDLHLEIDSVYTQNVPGGARDVWWWDVSPLSEDPGDLFPPYQTEGTSEDFTFSIQNIAAVSGSGRVAVDIQGRTSSGVNPDHHTRVYLNGMLVDDQTWDGFIPFTHDVAVSQTAFLEGTNTITLENVGDTGAAAEHHYVNWIEVDYLDSLTSESSRLLFHSDDFGTREFSLSGFTESSVLLLDVSTPDSPVELAGAVVSPDGPTWTVTFDQDPAGGMSIAAASTTGRLSPALEIDEPSNWADPSKGADLIVVVHPDLASSIQPLVDHRITEGLRVARVLTTDAYDEFNSGEENPAAIRDLVDYAYHNWQPPAPSVVLLAGDGTFDYRDNLGLSDVSLVPVWLTVISGFGETPDENFYVRVDGNDLLPDLAVGRLPARTPAELDVMVNRVLAYESSTPLASINDEILLVSDDDVIQFESTNNSLAVNHVPPAFTSRKVYRSQHSIEETRVEIDSGFDSGVLMANYFGHGNRDTWGKEFFWVNPDVENLANGDLVPFVTSLNCINGYFIQKGDLRSMSELYLTRAGGGAIGTWSPAAFGNIPDYDALIHRLYARVFGDHQLIMGPATMASLVEAYLYDGIQDRNLESLVYLGDPATHLRADSDRDGLLDEEEDENGTGVQDADSDDDGLNDFDEPDRYGDADGNGVVNANDPDADGDGLPDGLEEGVTVPGPDTDLGPAWFLADADPLTTTDPLLVDSDGGGVADGAEDRNRNGLVDGAETDPNLALDDDAAGCAPPPLPEVETILLSKSGADILLSWPDLSGTHPCALYRVYASRDQAAPKDDFGDWELLAVTPETGWRHGGVAGDGSSWDYLVATWTIADGEGALGHYAP